MEHEARFARIEQNIDDLTKSSADTAKNNAVTSALLNQGFLSNDKSHAEILDSIKEVKNKTSKNSDWIYKIGGAISFGGFAIMIALKFI